MSESKAPSLRITVDEEAGRGRYFEDPYVRNPDWVKYIEMIKEPAAEFLGTAVLIILGVGADVQTGLSTNPSVTPVSKGTEISINLGWAAAVALGVWLASAVSGGHCNPALTIGLAAWRGFPWRKVPGYLLAQTLGSFVGTAVVYGVYNRAVDVFEGGRGVRTLATASFFATYPLDYMTNAGCFFTELLATCIIFIVLLSIFDKRHGTQQKAFIPVMLFLLVLTVGTALGMQTNYAVNPARDLGARLLTALVGYGGQVFSFRGQYWLWCPIIAPILGCLLGGLIYDMCLFSTDFLPAAPPPTSLPSPVLPHKLKFDTYRSDRTQSVRAESHYDIDHNAMSSAV